MIDQGTAEIGAIGIAGLGKMGAPMARALITGFVPQNIPVLVHARDRSRPHVAELLQAGGTWTESPHDLAAADVVVIMVPDLPQVEELLDGDHGMLSAGKSDCVVAICSSVSPDGVRTLAQRAGNQSSGRVRLIDAPVSGGVEGAQSATLSLMVGGDDADVEHAWPVLQALGTPAHLGPVGSGSVAKACNQLVVAATITALSEASLIAERSGLSVDRLFEIFGRGYAGSRLLESKKQKLIDHDYSAEGVARFMVKDLAFAASAAQDSKTATPQLTLLEDLFNDLVTRGFGDEDLTAVQAYLALRS
jgi:2-hydroxy-3-oxopropionate reductase